MKTGIQRAFAPFKAVLPQSVWRPIRALATALITPVVFSHWSGHFRSSIKEKAVSRKGEVLPWYTYPCIHLLLFRDIVGKRVLEFGGGQSTLWWASRADQVVTLEGDPKWYAELGALIPDNVDLRLVSIVGKKACLADVDRVLKEFPPTSFDIVVIDSDFREDLVAVGLNHLRAGGALICDDAESYGFVEATQGLDIQRVDFFGHAPGVVLPRCTSVFFRDKCFLFDARFKIPDLAKVL